MKKSTVFYIALTCIFVATGWLIDYPFRYAALSAAVLGAAAALITALKGGKK